MADECKLSILRGWSSSVTLLDGSRRARPGGGYFLRWQNVGIALDPGFDFLRNFHDARYQGFDIDSVLVSHNHSDHNNDVRSIDDLRFELFKRHFIKIKSPEDKAETEEPVTKPYLLVLDTDSDKSLRIHDAVSEHRYSPIRFELGRCNPTDVIRRPRGMPFSIEYFKVEHGDDVPGSVGLKLFLEREGRKAFSIGYTGDTEYFETLPHRLQGCDLLLLHISQPDEKELSKSGIGMKQKHLGYRGAAELIRRAKPKLALVGEFWGGLSDLRLEIVEGLRKQSGRKAILPASLNMRINLPSMDIICSGCGGKVPYRHICVTAAVEPFGELGYFCESCRVGS